MWRIRCWGSARAASLWMQPRSFPNTTGKMVPLDSMACEGACQYLRDFEKKNPNTLESRPSRLAASSAASSFTLRL
jgi:hypothetical protein